MSPLEQYQNDKRSGLYESTTEPAAVPASRLTYPTPKLHPDSEAQESPRSVVLPDPMGKTKETVQIIYGDVMRLERKVKDMDNWVMGAVVMSVIALAISLGALYYVSKNQPEQKSTTTKAESTRPPQIQPKIITKTKIKKIYVAQKDSMWRRKMCYDYGDWNACRIYTKNLPARARVGRIDL